VDEIREPGPPRCVDDQSRYIRWEWKRWTTTWRGLGFLLAILVLPFGWLLPIAHIARVRVAARRRGSF